MQLYLKADRTAPSLGKKRGMSHWNVIGPRDNSEGRLIGPTKGDMNTKLHAVRDSQGRSIGFFVIDERSAIHRRTSTVGQPAERRMAAWGSRL